MVSYIFLYIIIQSEVFVVNKLQYVKIMVIKLIFYQKIFSFILYFDILRNNNYVSSKEKGKNVKSYNKPSCDNDDIK